MNLKITIQWEHKFSFKLSQDVDVNSIKTQVLTIARVFNYSTWMERAKVQKLKKKKKQKRKKEKRKRETMSINLFVKIFKLLFTLQ